MNVKKVILNSFVFLYSCHSSPDYSILRSENSNLIPGTPVQAELTKHKADTFRLNLSDGAFVYGYADQISIDVVINIHDPNNKRIGTFDYPSRGPEPFQFETKIKGIYKIVVSSKQDNEGSYAMVLSGVDRVSIEPAARIQRIMNAKLGINPLLEGSGITPGASVAVARDGTIVYSNGFGYANLEYNIKNSPSTIFHVASVSKQFTAFAIALLIDEGKLALNDEVRKYIPELPDFGLTITIDHLIHHTSGLRDQWNLLALAGWRLDDVITREQILRLISAQKDLNFLPGEEMVYCNTGYTLMAEIVSRVTGETFPDWTKTHIFDPLGMEYTFFYDDHEKIVKNRAYSYHYDPEGLKKSVLNYANVGATSLFTTVEDLCLWAMNFQDMKVGNQQVMDMMNRRFVLNNGDTIYYAFGQGVGNYKGLKTISHSGGDAGYRTFLLRIPDQQLSVAVFSNLASFNPGEIAYTIADIYLADELIMEDHKINQIGGGKEEQTIVNSEILKSYCGRYELFPGFIVTISIDGEQLRVHAADQPTLILEALSENVFKIQNIDATIIFQPDESGEVSQFTLKQGNQDNIAKRLPPFESSLLNLHEYTGNYFSPELLTTYRLDIVNDTLTAFHQRHNDIKFTPTQTDQFVTDAWFMGRIDFNRDDQHNVNGFKVSNVRVRNLVFEKE